MNLDQSNQKKLCLCLLVLIFTFTQSAAEKVRNKASISVRETSNYTRLTYTNKDSETLIDTKEKNNNSNEDEEETTGDPQPGKSAWIPHQEDHSIYSHRSLMSTSNIIHHSQNKDTDTQQVNRPTTGISAEDSDKNNVDISSEDYEPLRTKNYAEKEWQLMFRTFDLMYDSVTASIVQELGKQTDLFDEVVERLKPDCRRDIYHIRDSVKKHKLWALRMLDSNGKLPSGITYGRFSSPGDFEECLSVNVDESIYIPDSRPTYDNYKFRGKYCLLDFRLPLPPRPKDKLIGVHDPVIDLSDTELMRKFPELKNYTGYASVFYEVGYMHAFCLPSSCDVMDLTESVGKSLEGLHIIVNNTVECEQRFDEPQPYRTSQVIAMILLFLLFSNAIVASTIHYLREKNKNSVKMMRKKDDDHDKLSKNINNLKSFARNKLLADSFYSECFSIQTNLSRLTKPDPRGLTFVHYTRIVAMGLTVITHTAGMGTLQAITKPADTSNSEQMFRDFLPQMLANAFTSIQIFFFMAGFMLVISTFPSIKRERGHISFLEYAIKRAIRLLPGIAATICLNFLWPLIVDGPMLTYFIRIIVVPCEINWWRTLGFMSNFDHVEKMCLRHSYFSASDYQLHIMAFPLLLLLYKQPTISLFIAGLLTTAGFVAQVIMILTKTVIPFIMLDYIDKEAFFNVVHYIHHPVWNHMSAFFYGFIIGYLVIKQVRVNISEKTIKRIWMVVLPLGIISIFAPYFWNHYKRPIYRWQMVLYVIFDRFILLSTCAWLSYATMVLGRKPPAKREQVKIPTTETTTTLPSPDETYQPTSPSKLDVKQDASCFIRVPLNETESSQQQADDGLKKVGSSTSIPRQRSTPNLQSMCSENLNSSSLTTGGLMRTAESTINISSVGVKPSDVNQTINSQEVPATAPTTSSPKKKVTPISNVNTLCLILSRLTFQLYLFNMVVLWVDVTHSKYYWFFSYYFIITKAFAVYICSSLMAMIFFITLESPSLTLYIVWVKSRARGRAKTQTDKERKQKQEEKQDAAMNKTKTPAFNFIDLSTPPNPNDVCISNQTKM